PTHPRPWGPNVKHPFSPGPRPPGSASVTEDEIVPARLDCAQPVPIGGARPVVGYAAGIGLVPGGAVGRPDRGVELPLEAPVRRLLDVGANLDAAGPIGHEPAKAAEHVADLAFDHED